MLSFITRFVAAIFVVTASMLGHLAEILTIQATAGHHHLCYHCCYRDGSVCLDDWQSLWPMQVAWQQAELQRQAAAVASQGAQVRAAHVRFRDPKPYPKTLMCVCSRARKTLICMLTCAYDACMRA